MKNLFAKLLGHSPQTSLAGYFALALVGLAAYRDPSTMTQTTTLATITGAVGLICAQDNKAVPPAAPATE